MKKSKKKPKYVYQDSFPGWISHASWEGDLIPGAKETYEQVKVTVRAWSSDRAEKLDLEIANKAMELM